MLKSGICIVLEEILFLCPTRRQPTYYSKQKFRSNLRQLPAWDQTAYFCPKFPLHECGRASKLRPTRKEQIGDDGQSLAKLFKRENIEKFSGAGCQKMAAQGSFLDLSSLLRPFVNALKMLLTYGALLGQMSNWLQTKMKPTLSCMQVIGSKALRFIINLIRIAFLVLLFLFMLLKRQYERWLGKCRSSRRR